MINTELVENLMKEFRNTKRKIQALEKILASLKDSDTEQSTWKIILETKLNEYQGDLMLFQDLLSLEYEDLDLNEILRDSNL